MTENPAPAERGEAPRWQIGRLAALGVTTARAVRLYEAAGLMPEPARSAAGYRLYGPTDLATLIRIRRLRSLGFQIEQIQALHLPGDPADLGATLAVLRDDLLRRVEALRATIDPESLALRVGRPGRWMVKRLRDQVPCPWSG